LSTDIQKILVPIDYSGDAYQALQWGASLAERYRAQVILLHAIPKAVAEGSSPVADLTSPMASSYKKMGPGIWTKHPIMIDLQVKARVELHLFAYKNLKGRMPVQVKVAVGKPAEEIVRVAREEKVDLIVMGTHGRTGVQHLLLGSVADEVARHAPCPVFTVRSGAAAAA
jgi:nucleotide-binding universal stress UspA family protein